MSCVSHSLVCFFAKIHHRNFLSAMITRSSSIADILDGIISKIEVELEKNSPSRAGQSRFQDVAVSDMKRLLSTDSTEDANCRICYDPNQELPVVYPCRCKGTMGAIHLKCLERWLEEGNRNSCELCGQEFRVERTPRYKVLHSILIWLCLNEDQYDLYVHSEQADLLRCLIIAPVTVACTYMCVVATDFYASNNYDNFPPARWTTYSLLSMVAFLILSYFVWTYMSLQDHQKAWFHWWQKNSSVRIIGSYDDASVSNKRALSEV
ncbi:PREDICTED: E3 ubiquitin-protein ligase MARCH3-like [Dinoponera quadriceps]|uniref:E3 ubiquitin-protein ligase MARCH3-like n=1 Tax=Dinoponera quadriceps TaxID=609295 RepID=A0A6P3WP62_DINQU|nr:PREDICTED: E3 ubiquitin-protein ligase MARCH3-like [Dinoponera quadriceps]